MEQENNIRLSDGTVVEASAPIGTERMLLRHLKEEEYEIFDRHFEADENLTKLFTGQKNEQMYREMLIFSIQKKPNYFVMEGETHLPMGYIGLHTNDKAGVLEYYVFEEYRRRGFCREAVKALIAAAFEGKLRQSFGYFANKRRYHSLPTPIDLIKVRVFEYNFASENLLRSLGFTYSGYDFASRLFPDGSRVTEKLFYLEKPKTV